MLSFIVVCGNVIFAESWHMSINRALLLIFVIPAILMYACGSGEGSDNEDSVIEELRGIERSVMEAHDEVMPKMGDLNNTLKRLKTWKDSVATPEDMIPEVDQTIQDLVDADSLMWEWMYNYERPDYEGNLDSARLYLLSEQTRVNVVKERMLSSMAAGEQLLEKIKK